MAEEAMGGSELRRSVGRRSLPADLALPVLARSAGCSSVTKAAGPVWDGGWPNISCHAQAASSSRLV